MSNILIVYFSHKGKNYVGGNIVNLKVGNTAIAAEKIANQTGGKMIEIIPQKDYPLEYAPCTEVANVELRQNARPTLQNTIDIINYDTIILGFPNWWGTMPMPVWTFLESGDFTKKTIVPFCTNEGSGMGESVNDIKKLCPFSKIMEGLAITGSRVAFADKDISKWLKNSNVIS